MSLHRVSVVSAANFQKIAKFVNSLMTTNYKLYIFLLHARQLPALNHACIHSLIRSTARMRQMLWASLFSKSFVLNSHTLISRTLKAYLKHLQLLLLTKWWFAGKLQLLQLWLHNLNVQWHFLAKTNFHVIFVQNVLIVCSF